MQAPKIDLLNIDCMDYMSGLGNNAFDLAIVDPPYGIGESGGADRRGKSKHVKKDWDNKTPEKKYFIELQRVSQNQIIWGGNYFTDKLTPSRCWVAWDKKLYNSDFSDFELAWLSFDKGTKLYCLAKNGGSRTPAALTDIIHPTQKPVRLYDWLLQNYAKPGQRIIDTHLGSGSSAIAAHYFGCDFVGCELDKDYFEAAQKRFKSETRQLAFEYASA
jgi:site-specific DNA-methyltransferase (adenine-specific)